MNGITALLLLGPGLPTAAQMFKLRADPFGQGYGGTAFAVELADDGHYTVIAIVPFNDGQFNYSAAVTAIGLNSLSTVVLSDQDPVQPVHRW